MITNGEIVGVVNGEISEKRGAIHKIETERCDKFKKVQILLIHQELSPLWLSLP